MLRLKCRSLVMVCNIGTVRWCNNFFVITAAPLSLPELLSLLQLLVVFIINLSAFYSHLNNRSLCWVFEINLVVFGKKNPSGIRGVTVFHAVASPVPAAAAASGLHPPPSFNQYADLLRQARNKFVNCPVLLFLVLLHVALVQDRKKQYHSHLLTRLV